MPGSAVKTLSQNNAQTLSSIPPLLRSIITLPGGPRWRQGVGGEAATGLRVHHSTLEWLELGEQRFRDVSCLTAADDGSSIDLSAYSLV